MSPMIRSIDNTRKSSISIEFAEMFVGLKLLKICYNLKQYTIYNTLLNNLYIYIYIYIYCLAFVAIATNSSLTLFKF